MRKWLFLGIACVAIVLTIILVDGNANEKSHAKGSVATFTGVDLKCKDCSAKMEDALNKIIGIKKYHLNPEKNSVTVSFNSQYMQAEWIKRSLEAAGFNIKGIKE
ncbi:MAG: heavy-metal-associated domain-containing protein [Tuberibacillus sp.]